MKKFSYINKMIKYLEGYCHWFPGYKADARQLISHLKNYRDKNASLRAALELMKDRRAYFKIVYENNPVRKKGRYQRFLDKEISYVEMLFQEQKKYEALQLHPEDEKLFLTIKNSEY